MFTQHSIMLAAVSTIFLVGEAAFDPSKFPQEFTVDVAKSHAANGSYKIQDDMRDGLPWYQSEAGHRIEHDTDKYSVPGSILYKWVLNPPKGTALYKTNGRISKSKTPETEGWACYTHFSCDCPCPTLVETGTEQSKQQDAAQSPKDYFSKQMEEHFNHMKKVNLLAGKPAIPEVTRRNGSTINPQKWIEEQARTTANCYDAIVQQLKPTVVTKEYYWAQRGAKGVYNDLPGAWELPGFTCYPIEGRRRLASMGPAAQCLERRRLATGGPRTPPVLAALMAEIEEAKRLYETKCR